MLSQSGKCNFCSLGVQTENHLCWLSLQQSGANGRNRKNDEVFPKTNPWSKKASAGISLITDDDLKYHSSTRVCKLVLKSIQEDSKYSRCHYAQVRWALKCFWHPRLWRVVKHVAIFCLSLTALWSVRSLHFSAGKSASLKPPSQTISTHYPPGRTTFYPIYLQHPTPESASGVLYADFVRSSLSVCDSVVGVCVDALASITSCLDLSNSEWCFYPPAASPPVLSTQPITSPCDLHTHTHVCGISSFCLCLFKQHSDHNRLGVRERDQSRKWR